MNEFIIGFALGVLVTSLKDALLIRDLLDRATWKNPADYVYMVYMRKTVLGQVRDKFWKWVMPKVWKKKEKGELTKEVIQADLAKSVEETVKFNDEAEKHRLAVLKQREDAHNFGKEAPYL